MYLLNINNNFTLKIRTLTITRTINYIENNKTYQLTIVNIIYLLSHSGQFPSLLS